MRGQLYFLRLTVSNKGSGKWQILAEVRDNLEHQHLQDSFAVSKSQRVVAIDNVEEAT